MSAVFDKPSLVQRILPLFRGFDGILVLLCLLLAGAGQGGKASLSHPWLRSPLGLSLPSRQIGAGIINPVQTPIWPLGNPWPRVMPTAA